LNYDSVKTHCEKSSALSRTIIDNFLIYYAAERESLVPQMDKQLLKYTKVLREFPDEYINYLKSEFIGHRIFRRNGFISKYLDKPVIKNLPAEQFQYLKFQSEHPWRFSFAEIRSNPADSFFKMEDVMTGEKYLLYSPGMQVTEDEIHPRMWFNLIGFNGKCWQTFGLVIPFRSYSIDDIFFFATELNPLINDEEDLMKFVDEGPFPFFMLLAAANIPVVDARGYETVLFQATDSVKHLSGADFDKTFTVEWCKNVYRLTSRQWGEFPHFGVAYFNEQRKELVRTAMTEVGFVGLTQELEKQNLQLDQEADIAVSLGMYSVTQKIFNKKIELNPYEKLFKKSISAHESEDLKHLNQFMQLALPYYNSNQEPDIKMLAEQAGLSPEIAADVWEKVKGNMDDARTKAKRK
jgi:hypothetical protein